MNHVKLHPLQSNQVANMWSEEELPEGYWENFLKESIQIHTSNSNTNKYLVQGKEIKDRRHGFARPLVCYLHFKS